MKPLEGTDKFLGQLIQLGILTMDELEQVFKIAAIESPTGAFKAVLKEWTLTQAVQANLEDYYNQTRDYQIGIINIKLALQKGTRWLAMVRRDHGQQVFEDECARLRALVQ